MPIQWGFNQYAQFVYDPDYLKDSKYSKYKTDVEKVLCKLKFMSEVKINKSELIVDGGNLVFCSGYSSMNRNFYIVMTDKVFAENPHLSQAQIETMIKEAFTYDGHKETDKLRIVWLPWDKMDKCGHTDGILRYIGTNKNGKPIVLVNLEVYEPADAEVMQSILEEHFDVIKLQLSQYDDMSWAYINCLQTKDIIIVPGIGNKVTDNEALSQIKDLYPQYAERVYLVQMHDFIEEGGGALNCCTWTIARLPLI